MDIIIFALVCFFCGWGAGRAHYRLSLKKANQIISSLQNRLDELGDEINQLMEEDNDQYRNQGDRED